MVIVIRGRRHGLWWAVDNEGEVLDFLVQSARNAGAALKLMRKLLKKHGWAPTWITTDKLRSHHVVIRTLGLTAEHIDKKLANNRAENSHQPVRRRERKQQRSKSPGSAPDLKYARASQLKWKSAGLVVLVRVQYSSSLKGQFWVTRPALFLYQLRTFGAPHATCRLPSSMISL